MQALAARDLEERRETELTEKIAHLDRGGFENGEIEILVRIKIEHDMIGLVTWSA